MKNPMKTTNISYTCNVRTNYQKIDKVLKNLDCQPTKQREERYKLTSSTYQKPTYQISDPVINKKTKFFPTTKRRVIYIKFGTKKLTRKLKPREILQN